MGCGTCCVIRERAIMSPKQDKELRSNIYNRIGILYLYPMSRYTISLSHEEKLFFEKESLLRGIVVSIIPKKIRLIDGKFVVQDWSIDHDICPFFSIDNKRCTIYENRPSVCMSFPNQHKFDFIVDSDNVDRLPFAESMKLAKNSISKI